MNSALTRIGAVSIRARLWSMRLCIDHDRYCVFSFSGLPKKDSLYYRDALCISCVFFLWITGEEFSVLYSALCEYIYV